MLAPSVILSPLFLVIVALSDPARSISDILACMTVVVSPVARGFWFTNTCSNRHVSAHKRTDHKLKGTAAVMVSASTNIGLVQ